MNSSNQKLFLKQIEKMAKEELFKALENMFIKLDKRRQDRLKKLELVAID